MPLSLLDELIFIPGRMPPVESPPTLDVSVSMEVRDTSRRLRIGSPWFVRDVSPAQLGKRWTIFCGLLRAANIPAFCRTSDLESVAAATVPMRFARRAVNEPLHAQEVKTADALELDSRMTKTEQWAWPAEVGKLANLGRFVQAVRVAAGNTTPIGLSLPVGAKHDDLKACLDAEVDFVTLVDHHLSLATDALLVESLASLRGKCVEAGRSDLPILLATSTNRVEDVSKLLALGASAVSIDLLIMNELLANQPTEPQSGGMLSGIGAAPKPKQDLAAVERVLAALADSLTTSMQAVGATRLNEFNTQHLRSLTERTSNISSIPMLGS